MKPEFSEFVLAWYDQHARALPWRGHVDPYGVWVSEIMLQQTRVDTVIPYFERWMIQFPSIASLAEAPQQAVLSAWEGLGYYSRVRNLHQAARLVMLEYGGEIPHEINLLRKLPGIGRYTAAAIASIAFQQDVATLDGNLRRVFARVFDVSQPADASPGEEILWSLAQDHLPIGRAGDYNQALMDLGSAVCLPKKPLCLECPLEKICQSLESPESRPVLKPRPVVPHRTKMAAVLVRAGKVLLALRPSKGLLGGLWEFPSGLVEVETEQSLMSALSVEYGLVIRPIKFLVKLQHAYTHFTLTESAWYCELVEESVNQTLSWVAISELSNFPMGKVDRAIASKILGSHQS